MIQPVLRGADLATQMREEDPGHGLALWWLGRGAVTRTRTQSTLEILLAVTAGAAALGWSLGADRDRLRRRLLR